MMAMVFKSAMSPSATEKRYCYNRSDAIAVSAICCDWRWCVIIWLLNRIVSHHGRSIYPIVRAVAISIMMMVVAPAICKCC